MWQALQGYPSRAVRYLEALLRKSPGQYNDRLELARLYLNGFRDRRISHEASINTIFRDLHDLLSPQEMDVTGDFNVRGNLKTVIRVDTEMNRRKKKR
jgi:Enzyme related to GTP cyclohydrolase I